MSALAHSFTETTAISSLIGTTYTTVHTHGSANFTAGNKYLLLCKFKLFGEDANGNVRYKFRHGTTDFADSEHIIQPFTASGGADFPSPESWFEVWTAVSGEDITLQIQGASATGEAQVDQVMFLAIDLTSLTENTDYWYATSVTDVALTAAGVDGASITLTPPAGTDLWVLTEARIDVGGITSGHGSRIVSTGTFAESIPQGQHEPDDATNEIISMEMERVFINLANSSQTFKEQAFNASAVGTRLHSKLFALRLNIFNNRAVAWTAAAEALGTTAWADPLDVGRTFTPSVAGDCLFSVAGILAVDAALREVINRLQIDNVDQPATQTADTYDECWAGDPNDDIPFGTMTVENLAASTQVTMDWEGHTNTITQNAQHRSTCIFSFELASTAQTVTPSPVVVTMAATTPTVVKGPISVSPAAVAAVMSAPAPTILNVFTLAPAPAVAAMNVQTPTVVRGAVTLAPTPVAVVISTTTPVVTNAKNLFPDPVVAAMNVQTPVLVKGTVTIAPTPVVAVMSTTTPTVVKGPISVSPSPVVATMSTTTPTVVKGIVTLATAPVVATMSTTTPTVVKGAVVLTPPPVVVVMSVTTPTLVKGAVALAPTPVIATMVATTPVLLGAGTVAPSPVVATMAATTPNVFKGPISVSPAPATASFSTPTPTVASIYRVASAPVVATFAVVAPNVVRGGITPTPGAVAAAFTTTTPIVIKGVVTVTPGATVAIFSTPTPSVSGFVAEPAPVVAAFTVPTPVAKLGPEVTAKQVQAVDTSPSRAAVDRSQRRDGDTKETRRTAT